MNLVHEFPKVKLGGRSLLYFFGRNKVGYDLDETGLVLFHSSRDYEMARSIWYHLTGSTVFGRFPSVNLSQGVFNDNAESS